MTTNNNTEKSSQSKTDKILDAIYKILILMLTIMALVGGYFGGRAYVADWFVIPTGSMEPTLIPGDWVIVNKLVAGARIYDEFDFRDGVPMRSHRTKGLRHIEHNDVVIFNCPMDRKRTKMVFEINYVYGKRCIGLPGDSVSICNGYFKNNNYLGVLGNKQNQDVLAIIPEDDLSKGIKSAMPFDNDNFGWTIKNFGPLYVPRMGGVVDIDSLTIKLYRDVIEFESGLECTVSDNNEVYLDNNKLNSYVFKRNYYFMCGDNVMDSNDSRYWGFVPEEFIIGVVSHVIFSKDRNTDEFRWNRLIKSVLK